MPEYIQSVEELRELHPDAQEAYFSDLNVFSEAEWDLYRDDVVEDYAEREVTRRTFTADDGTEYLLSAERVPESESSDEAGTRINVVELESE